MGRTTEIALAHATGFCGGVWDPVVGALAGTGQPPVVQWSFAGHGGRPSPPDPISWWLFGRQVLDETSRGAVGVGHSMGGTAIVMAELEDPGRFAAMVLVEPVIFETDNPALVEPLVEAALRRTRWFPDRRSARAHFASKAVFSRWDAASLDGYVGDGLVDVDDGVVLACSPEFEAEVYRHYHRHDVWDRLAEVECPVLVLAGEFSDTYPPDLARRLAVRFPRAGWEVVADSGHFLPMERPQLVAARVKALVRGLLVDRKEV